MLVGLLSAFKKFILIGDHKQLPAVVMQSELKSKVSSQQLNEEVGLIDTRMSLFERMYKQAQKNNWDWAYGRLTRQGRMHEDLVSFISQEFYGGQLNILKGLDRLTARPAMKAETELQQSLIDHRLIFIDTPKGNSITRKTNLFEAEKVIKVMSEWQNISHHSDLR